MAWIEKGQGCFAQVGDAAYLCEVVGEDADGGLLVSHIHWISRKGTGDTADLDFHHKGWTTTGCEIIYRGPALHKLPITALVGHWPHDLPMASVKAGKIWEG